MQSEEEGKETYIPATLSGGFICQSSSSLKTNKCNSQQDSSNAEPCVSAASNQVLLPGLWAQSREWGLGVCVGWPERPGLVSRRSKKVFFRVNWVSGGRKAFHYVWMSGGPEGTQGNNSLSEGESCPTVHRKVVANATLVGFSLGAKPP